MYRKKEIIKENYPKIIREAERRLIPYKLDNP